MKRWFFFLGKLTVCMINMFQETYDKKINCVLFNTQNLTIMNTIEYSWRLYLKFKNRGIIKNNYFFIISLKFYNSNKLGHITHGKQQKYTEGYYG